MKLLLFKIMLGILFLFSTAIVSLSKEDAKESAPTAGKVNNKIIALPSDLPSSVPNDLIEKKTVNTNQKQNVMVSSSAVDLPSNSVTGKEADKAKLLKTNLAEKGGLASESAVIDLNSARKDSQNNSNNGSLKNKTEGNNIKKVKK